MKTVKNLNSKVWYRFLKVIYVLFFLPFFISSIYSGYGFTKPHFDNEESYILCDNGQKLRAKSLTSSYISISHDKTYKRICAIQESSVGETLSEEEFLARYSEIKNQDISSNYKLVSVFTKRNWFKAIGTSVLLTFVIYFFFELTRRIFYYILLGSFIPKKEALK